MNTATPTEIILAIEAKGEIVHSNLSKYCDFVGTMLEMVNLDLSTDAEFGKAAQQIKVLRHERKKIAAAKESALKSLVDVHAELLKLDNTDERILNVCSNLEKQIKTRTAEVKTEIAEEFLDMLIEALGIDPRDARRNFFVGLQTAIKGKHTVESMRSACRVYQSSMQAAILASRDVLNRYEAKFGADSIPDRRELELKSAEMVEAELVRRIQARKAAEEAAKLKAEADAAKAETAKAQAALVEAKQPAAATPPQNVTAFPAPVAESPTVAAQLTEREELLAYDSAAVAACAALKAAKEWLTYPKNIAKVQGFASAVNVARRDWLS